MKLFWEVLGKEQIKLLPRLRFLKEEGFYLSGGTSLALQINHRTSVDFDFYNEKEFSSEDIVTLFQKKIKDTTIVQTGRGTLITKAGNTEISLFYYPYKLLAPLVETESIVLTSLQDIAAMKLVAIIQRGKKRDFFDLYFLVKTFGFGEVFKLTSQKYPPFNPYLGLRALTYFEDAEREDLKERKIVLFNPITWKEVKEFFIKETKNYYKEKLQ
ncbi:MAG: nucleotidyl transferase AbiEii/AbiGii toxin family protein [Candidatus Omnitrophota bacterium]